MDISKSVMEEVVKAQIKAWSKTDEGKEYVRGQIEDASEDLFPSRYDGWNRSSFQEIFRTKLNDYVDNEKLTDLLNSVLPEIISLGFVQYFSLRGYKLKLEKKN